MTRGDSREQGTAGHDPTPSANEYRKGVDKTERATLPWTTGGPIQDIVIDVEAPAFMWPGSVLPGGNDWV